jgi:hypothetical protein
MASTTVFSFTPNQLPAGLTGAAVVAKGAIARGTIDLRGKGGGKLFAAVGKGGTTALSAGALVGAFPLIDQGGGVLRKWSNTINKRQTNTTTVNGNTTCATSDSAANQNVLTVASVTGFAAGDTILIQDAGGGVTRAEFGVISKIVGSTLVLRENLEYAHTAAGADTVRNQADIFPMMELDGGDQIEVVLDYGAEATGDSLTVLFLFTSFDGYATSP